MIFSRIGNSSYPLGGFVTAGLILSTSAAFVTTVYATASCRFVVVTFTSSLGNFEEHFNSAREGNDQMTYRTAIGLYQWLRPFDPEDWTVGTCVGYQQTMIDAITDTMFDVSRTMSVFAILIAIFQFCWMFLSSCLSMNRLQCYLFLFLSFLGTMCTGLTFLFRRSTICTTEFDAVDCKIDQGGLVMIAAILLWVLTLAVSIYYVYPTVMAVSTASSVDFELHKTRTEKDKMKLAKQRERRIQLEMLRQQQSKETIPQSSSKQQFLPDEGNQIRASYSFDSLQSWARPIPKRHQRSSSFEPNVSKATHLWQQSGTQRVTAPLTTSMVQPLTNRNSEDKQEAASSPPLNTFKVQPIATNTPKASSILEPLATVAAANDEDIEVGRLYSPAIADDDDVAAKSKKSALDVYIAERLDRIEMLTN